MEEKLEKLKEINVSNQEALDIITYLEDYIESLQTDIEVLLSDLDETIND